MYLENKDIDTSYFDGIVETFIPFDKTAACIRLEVLKNINGIN
jgi:hypothetical protein